MPGKIFVNYRRDDSAPHALSIAQYLEREFGPANVFLDIDRMRAGEKFPKVLEERLAVSKAMLVVIGPQWLALKNDNGTRRLDDPEDWVRLEIARALARGIPVIPVLVGGASLPKKSDLPDDLRALIDHQVATVTTNGFRAEMACLARDINTLLGPRRRWPIAAGLISVIAGAVGFAMYAGLIPMMGLGSLLYPGEPVPRANSPPAASAAQKAPAKELAPEKQQPAASTAPEAKKLTIAEARRKVEEAKAKRNALLGVVGDEDSKAAKGADPAGLTSDSGASTKNQAAKREREGTPSVSAPRVGAGRAAVEALKPGTVFRDCSTCPEMVVVPAGEFMMGPAQGEEKPVQNERLQRRIKIERSFAVGTHEVTVQEFEVFASENAVLADAGGCAVWTAHGHRFEQDRSFRSPSFSQLPTHPAVCVSWQAAVEYGNWLSTKTGKMYRLPSEAEWEYAARANSTTRYFFGDDEAEICEHGNAADRTSAFMWGNGLCSDGAGVQTAPAGQYKPNAFGIYDMLGNAAEWVEDCASPDLSAIPLNGAAATRGDCSQRITRGGAWDNGPKDVRTSVRGGYPLKAKDTIGFRVVRELD
jgi:formylglycine-generating enzyme required for sulfatase activity